MPIALWLHERGHSVSYADQVRAYCAEHIIEPARAQGQAQVEIRAGDVHKALGFRNRLPLVCSALGTAVFENQYRLRRISVEGPLNGSNTMFRFAVLP